MYVTPLRNIIRKGKAKAAAFYSYLPEGLFLTNQRNRNYLLKNKRSYVFAAKAQQPMSLGAKLGKFLSLPGGPISLSALYYETIYN